MGLSGDCETDPNNDGIVDVFDLLYILTKIGDDCPVEQDLSIGMLKDLTVASSGGIFGGAPRRYLTLLAGRSRVLLMSWPQESTFSDGAE